MSNEFVLLNKDGDEIEWFEPVSQEPTVRILVDGRGFYEVPISSFVKYEHREYDPDKEY